MKLIIDIDDYDFEWIRNGHYIPLELNTKMVEMILSGIPLDDIKAEIQALPKTYPFINHIDTYVKEDDVVDIIRKHTGVSE